MNILEVIDPGLGMTFQDRGRPGWRRFGVPSSGAMDDHAAGWANRLLDNPPDAPVLELLLQGARLRVLNDAWLAVTGADADASVPTWRTVRVKAGDEVRFPHIRRGVWTYVAIEGGFDAPHVLGSASVCPRGRLGAPLTRGDVLRRRDTPGFHLPEHVAGRTIAWDERRDYNSPPPLRVWPGPQWDFFGEADRSAFFSREWTVAPQSDRVGYRLHGEPLKLRQVQILSEPVLVGSVQVPDNGQPIVTMRDGPTVGGYPKLGVLDPADVSWLAQCRPGQKVSFKLVT
ncbi:MAG: biotin-dependent carboxyltransferase family protein [Planctomycetes bacterium]|nr:biotin-dependent carboxyltransferase family protein [Planctomycetota bacterium]